MLVVLIYFDSPTQISTHYPIRTPPSPNLLGMRQYQIELQVVNWVTFKNPVLLNFEIIFLVSQVREVYFKSRVNF